MQLASTGNASDHGDLTTARGYAAATSNGTRALCAGGNSVINNIDFGSIAQAGNFTDFGDLTVSRNALTGICGTTRGIFAGGTDGTSPSPAYQNVIDYITINSTGNATDFGDLSGKSGYMASANDSSGKAFFIGGASGGDSSKNNQSTDVITIASTGNASAFGTLTQMTRTAASVSQGTTAITMGGASPSYNNVIQRFVMPSLGNATDFGDLSRSAGSNKGGCGSHDGIDWGSAAVQRPSVTYMPGSGRALLVGGEAPASPYNSTAIDMLMIPTLGNSSDFGDVTVSTGYGLNGTSNVTRGLIGAGYVHPAANNTIRSIELASQGNTADFGDTTVARYYLGAAASATRCLWGGGDTGSISDVIDYKTFASSGNASDFGNLTVARGGTPAGCSSPTRATFGGGQTSPAVSDVIDYVTIGSTGNATDFGNLSVARQALGGTSSATRGLMAGGITPSLENTIDYITIASTGNAADFGDLFVAHSRSGNSSDNHGGLQSA